MKRSEMLKILEQTIENTYGCDPEGGFLYPPTDYIAFAVLKKIEEIGMLPPFDYPTFQLNWRDGETGHKWEPEN